MKIRRVNTSSFGISNRIESRLIKRSRRRKLNLIREYHPLARFRSVRVGELDKHGKGIRKSENTIYVDLADCSLYILKNRKGIFSNLPRLDKLNIINSLMGISDNLIKIIGHLVESGSSRIEEFNENEILQLRRAGLIEIYEPKTNKIFNIFRVAFEMKEVGRYYVRPSYKIPKFNNKCYDLSSLDTINTIDTSYKKRKIEHSIERIANILRNLFLCDIVLEEICYLPCILIESSRKTSEMLLYYPICFKNSSDIKRNYATEETLKPISLSIEIDAEESIPIEKTTITFNDIGGLKDAKKEIMESIVYPFLNPEISKKFGWKVGGGILLYGPPGCGKTHLARATVTECGVSFFNVNISDILSGKGDEAEKMHKIFERAFKNAPAVIFFDEIDALCTRKGELEGTKRRVLNQFLMDMSGVEGLSEGVLVIAATDTPWDLDPALRRSGRFSKQIFVPPPDKNAREEIFRICTRGKPIAEDIDFKKLAELTEGYSAADIAEICRNASRAPWKEAITKGIERKITMDDFLRAINEQKSTLIPWAIKAEKLIEESGEKDVYYDLYLAVKELNRKFKKSENEDIEVEEKKKIEVPERVSEELTYAKSITNYKDELEKLILQRDEIKEKMAIARERFESGKMDEEIYLKLSDKYKKQLADVEFRIKLLTFKQSHS